MTVLDWSEIPELEFVDLQDSFVLSWSEVAHSLTFRLEASLWQGHADYSEPKPNEHTCYKSAELVFTNTFRVDGLLSMANVVSALSAEGSADYGTIDTLQRDADGVWLICGDFGSVRIHCGDCTFRIL
jgi:hypothetical protein